MFSKHFFNYLFKLHLLCLAFLFLLRLTFILYHFSSIVSPSFLGITQTFLIGALFDSCIISSALFIAWLIAMLFSFFLKERSIKLFLHLANVLIALVFFTNIADIFFFNQYGVRLNMFAGEAANDPGKIVTTAWKIYPIIPIVLCYSVLLFVFIRLHRKAFRTISLFRTNSRKWAVLTPVTLFALSFLYYGPPLWTLANFSNSSVLNQASLNGAYTFIKSYDQQRIYADDIPQFNYGTDENAVKHLLDSIVKPGDSLLNSYYPTLRTSHRDTLLKKKNVVIILLESFGSKYIGKLNEGKGLSPNFDRISESGVLFTQCRSNGPRTQFGIMSTVAGYPSILGINLQRRKGLNEFQTLGNILLAQGYETKFIHNGHADYDEMDKFMTQGGFETVFDVNDYKTWRIKNEWGVSDEDLYDKAYDMIWNTNEKPVLSVLLTMSNHEPHELPAAFRKKYPEVNKMNPKEATFFYTDVALGDFLDKCAKHPQYSNTLFVILADHGDSYTPVDNECKIFHIPMMILNSEQEKGVFGKACSQCDIPSTVLADLSYSGNFHFIGQDIFGKDFKPYAFMRAYGQDVYLCCDSVMLKYYFETGKSEFFYLDKYHYQRPAENVNEKLKGQMTAYTKNYLQSISWLFRNGRYRFAN